QETHSILAASVAVPAGTAFGPVLCARHPWATTLIPPMCGGKKRNLARPGEAITMVALTAAGIRILDGESMRSKFLVGLYTASMILFASSMLQAQATASAVIQGTVMDQTQARLPGASVMILDTTTRLSRAPL